MSAPVVPFELADSTADLDQPNSCGPQDRPQANSRRGGADAGVFAALELAILTPFVIAMLLLVTAFGRVSHGREKVNQAAQAAARAGSLALDPDTAQIAATRTAQGALTDGGSSCSSVQVTVDTSQFYPGGQLTARVTCHADLSGLTMSGVPGSVTLSAWSSSPLESYRQLGGGG